MTSESELVDVKGWCDRWSLRNRSFYLHDLVRQLVQLDLLDPRHEPLPAMPFSIRAFFSRYPQPAPGSYHYRHENANIENLIVTNAPTPATASQPLPHPSEDATIAKRREKGGFRNPLRSKSIRRDSNSKSKQNNSTKRIEPFPPFLFLSRGSPSLGSLTQNLKKRKPKLSLAQSKNHRACLFAHLPS